MVVSRFLEALRQGCVDPVHAARLHGGKGSPPPAPDYKGAAEATQKSQMSSQYTPYGSQVYSPDQNSPSGYRSDITLAPEAQATLDSQMRMSRGVGDIASGVMPRVADQYSRPMELGSVNDIYNKSYDAMTPRLDDRFGREQTSLETQLTNQGLRPGDEAWDNAMKDFNYGKNDAYQQANLAAINTMPQTYQLASSEYQQPLNILNALRTGAQIQNPQFTSQPGANYAGAAQSAGQYAGNLYNTQVGQQNAMVGGLAGLGSAAIFASDRRLKSNIVRVGDHPLGIGIYEYDIEGRRERGVMADEVEKVMPEAVLTREDGYKMVNYGLVGRG